MYQKKNDDMKAEEKFTYIDRNRRQRIEQLASHREEKNIYQISTT